MLKFATSQHSSMNEILAQIAMTSDNQLQRAERSYKAVQEALEKVKEFALSYTFKDSDEEIRFFKEIKPQFTSQVIFYRELFYIEAGKPVGSKDSQSAYYKQALERINSFFDRNLQIYIYYRTGRDNYDSQYFIRNSGGEAQMPEYSVDIDPRFSTIQSSKFGKIQAYEQLTEYLQRTLHHLEHPEQALEPGEKRAYRNLWTDTKAALIELAYALHSRGSVNQGKGDVKQLITDLELLFNVQVGNFYRTFQSMRIRKKNRTAYLDNLKESLERRMDDTDLSI